MKRSEALMLSYLLRADEFYILTRFSNRAFFQYMTFRMAHHALEYYLKAGLSKKITNKDMKKLGHNIEDLWGKYKIHNPNICVDTRIISHINQFETMRYPGMSKYVGILWGTSYDELFSDIFHKVTKEIQNTVACFSLQDFDKLVFTLRTSLAQGIILPMIIANDDTKAYLFYENEYFKKG